MNTYRFCTGIALAAALALAGTASAVVSEFCTTPMTAAIAGSASPASGTFTLLTQSDPDPLIVEVQITHNVANATSVELRAGAIGATGTLISNLGGATGNSIDYTLTDPEAQALVAANPNWYVVVNSAAFPSPSGAIRADAATCYQNIPTEGQTEGGLVLPEGLADYDCNLTINAAQMVDPAPNTTYTGTVHIFFEALDYASMYIVHTVPDNDFKELSIYKGAPGVDGTQERRITTSAGPTGHILALLSQAEVEAYAKEPHYILIEALSGKSIRADIVGCPFDDGVVNEGIVDGATEGGGEGTPLPCEQFSEGEPADLICGGLDLTAAAVVPATTSPYVGGVQFTGPIQPDDQVLFVVRHNVPAPTAINIYQGAPGTNGTLFKSYTSGLTCPFAALLPSDYLLLLQSQPFYVEVETAGDANATIRGDLVCGILVEGEGEGTPVVTDGEGQAPLDLKALADALLLLFKESDGDHSGQLTRPEAQFVVSSLTDEQFATMDSDGNLSLSTAELHRYAGPVRKHNGDTNGDAVINLAELLRLIQLYNADGYVCVDTPGSTEDGFAPAAGAKAALPCLPHASDYIGGADFKINLSELLRAIQLFNFGSYTYCPDSDPATDDYCIDTP